MARRAIPYSFTPDTGAKPKRRISVGWSIGLTVLLSLVLTVFANGLIARAEATDPGGSELINVVFDGADLFTPEEEEQINLHAKDLLETYGTAMAVETVSTVNGKDMESWTVDRANERRLGSSELDNGLFYGIAVDDREFYVAKGDGYAAIPDYKLQEILDSQMVPRFKEDNYAQGVIDSSQSFGELAVSPSATEDTRAEESAAANRRTSEIAGAIGIWAVGIIGAAGVGTGAVFAVLTVKRRKQERIEAEARAERKKIEAEKRRIAEEARRKRIAAIGHLTRTDWKDFARLPDGDARRSWLMERGIYAAAFDIPETTLPGPRYVAMLDSTISSEVFGGVPFLEGKSVREAEKAYTEEQERARIARAAAEKQRREEEKVRDEAKDFWRRLSDQDKREFSKLRSEQDRQNWVTSHGGGNIFGLNPIIAIAMFLSLSNSFDQAEARAAESARSSSTDYSSSSYTDYSSSNMFGGGSFGGGGGAGGSW